MSTRDDAAMPRPSRRAATDPGAGFKALNTPDERAKHPEPMRTVTFTLPVRLHKEMKKAAADHEVTLRTLFQEALEAHLERLGQETDKGGRGNARPRFQDIPLH